MSQDDARSTSAFRIDRVGAGALVALDLQCVALKQHRLGVEKLGEGPAVVDRDRLLFHPQRKQDSSRSAGTGRIEGWVHIIEAFRSAGPRGSGLCFHRDRWSAPSCMPWALPVTRDIAAPVTAWPKMCARGSEYAVLYCPQTLALTFNVFVSFSPGDREAGWK
jgi:hypothetical protein